MYKISILLTSVLFVGCATTPPSQTPEFVPVRPIISAPPPQDNGSIYQTGYGVSLFSDVSAKRVGDIITIVLNENINASKRASTNTSKDSSVSVPVPTLLGGALTKDGRDLLNTSLEAGRSFSGSGDSSQSNSLNGQVTVTVSEVLPNGYLMVQGEKRLTLNQGSEHIQFSGIVRPADIRSDNTVISTNVANAQIIYGGHGSLADANTEGWFTRMMSSPWWPF